MAYLWLPGHRRVQSRRTDGRPVTAAGRRASNLQRRAVRWAWAPLARPRSVSLTEGSSVRRWRSGRLATAASPGSCGIGLRGAVQPADRTPGARVRVCSRRCCPTTSRPEEVCASPPDGLILSGGPASVYADGAPKLDPGLLELGIPVLGICYGMQLIARELAARSRAPRSGNTGARNSRPQPLGGCWPRRRPSRRAGCTPDTVFARHPGSRHWRRRRPRRGCDRVRGPRHLWHPVSSGGRAHALRATGAA